jgi:hypothetical protein
LAAMARWRVGAPTRCPPPGGMSLLSPPIHVQWWISGGPPGRPEALDPEEPFSPQPHPSGSACPDRALPRYALLRAAAAGRRCVLGTPPAPWATMAAGGGGRRERRGENAV